jgi:hypothetical protein
MNVEVKKYRGTRHFAVYLDDELLAVCLYKKGGMAIKELLERMAVANPPVLITQSMMEVAMAQGNLNTLLDIMNQIDVLKKKAAKLLPKVSAELEVKPVVRKKRRKRGSRKQKAVQADTQKTG